MRVMAGIGVLFIARKSLNCKQKKKQTNVTSGLNVKNVQVHDSACVSKKLGNAISENS